MSGTFRLEADVGHEPEFVVTGDRQQFVVVPAILQLEVQVLVETEVRASRIHVVAGLGGSSGAELIPLQIKLEPIRERDAGMQQIYDGIFSVGEERINLLKEDVNDKYEASLQMFRDAPEEDREYLQLFSYVCLLSYDIFIKKLLIERIIDEMKSQSQSSVKGKKES